MPVSMAIPKPPKKSGAGSGNIENDCRAELSEVAAGFRKRAATESARKSAATDGDFYLCVIFASQEQVEAFLKATGVGKINDRFIDGREMARAMGVNLQPCALKTKLKKPSSRLANLVMGEKL